MKKEIIHLKNRGGKKYNQISAKARTAEIRLKATE